MSDIEDAAGESAANEPPDSCPASSPADDGAESEPRSNAESEEDPGWTPLRIVAAFVLLAILGSLGGAMATKVQQRRKAAHAAARRLPEDFLRAELAAPDTAPLTSPVAVSFRLINESEVGVAIYDQPDGRGARRDQYDVRVYGEGGRRLEDPRPWSPETPQAPAGIMRIIRPGETVEWTLNLLRYAKIEEPGEYSIEIQRNPFADKLRIKAGPIRLRLTRP